MEEAGTFTQSVADHKGTLHLNGCVKENELVQNLTIIQHKGLGLVPVFFISQSIDSGNPGGSLGSKESFNNRKEGVFWEISMKITLTLVILQNVFSYMLSCIKCSLLPLAMRGVSIFFVLVTVHMHGN